MLLAQPDVFAKLYVYFQTLHDLYFGHLARRTESDSEVVSRTLLSLCCESCVYLT